MKTIKTIPDEDIEHEALVFYCPEDIEKWVRGIIRKGEAYRYDFIGWSDDLWNKTAVEALNFIEERFRETTDPREYYVAMLYLMKRIESEELFVPWKESSNYRAILAQKEREKNQGGTNTLPQKVPGVGSRREPYRGLVGCMGYRGRHVRV